MLHSLAFYLAAILTLVSAIAAMTLRNLVHCALCVAASFAGIAIVYLQLGAEFVGFAQILVYIGAVAILVLFTILLTRDVEVKTSVAFLTRLWPAGVGVAALVLAAIVAPILLTPALHKTLDTASAAPDSNQIQQIGKELMSRYILPMEIVGLLLTAALLGAVVIAMREEGKSAETPSANPNAPLASTGGKP